MMNADEMSAGSGNANALDVEYGRRKNRTLPHTRRGDPAAADTRAAANDAAKKKRVLKHVIEDDCMFQLLKVRNAKICCSAACDSAEWERTAGSGTATRQNCEC